MLVLQCSCALLTNASGAKCPTPQYYSLPITARRPDTLYHPGAHKHRYAQTFRFRRTKPKPLSMPKLVMALQTSSYYMVWEPVVHGSLFVHSAVNTVPVLLAKAHARQSHRSLLIGNIVYYAENMTDCSPFTGRASASHVLIDHDRTKQHVKR